MEGKIDCIARRQTHSRNGTQPPFREGSQLAEGQKERESHALSRSATPLPPNSELARCVEFPKKNAGFGI